MTLRLIKRHGLIGALKRIPHFFLDDLGLRRKYLSKKYPQSVFYKNPTVDDISKIENQLSILNIAVHDLHIDTADFKLFCSNYQFPHDYHGGINSPVWTEKLLEHYIAFNLIGLANLSPQETYIDIAACNSPWAKILKEKNTCDAFAIDLAVPSIYEKLEYYIEMDATKTSFDDNSVSGISLQCAYEMFINNDDIHLIDEIARILKPGGKAVISPLYMHTHYCAYSSYEHFGKGLSPSEATEYINLHAQNIPSSRKYDANQLKSRILDRITDSNLQYKLFAIRNKQKIDEHVYCHFVLLIIKE